MTKLRVAFLVHELGRSGGIAVVLRNARRLAEREGFEPEIVLTGPKLGSPPGEVDGVPVRTLAEARGGSYDLGVATWWATTEALYELQIDRRVVFLQSAEHRFYRREELPDWSGALSLLALPVHFVCTSLFLEELLSTLRPDVRCVRVRPGIDKSVFRQRTAQRRDGPLRVLVEGQPTLWFKGVQDSIAAARLMRQPAEVTLAAPDGGSAEELGVDRVVSAGTPAEMADLYTEHDVLLKLSRVEGLGLAPLEGFHAGVPCVITPFTGSDDYIEHGANGLVAGFDDIDATAALLDRLAGDGELLANLSEGALRTAQSWPDAADSADRFADALLELHSFEPPRADEAIRHMLRTQRLAIELLREYGHKPRAVLALRERQLAELSERIERIEANPVYRVGKRVRGLARRRPR